MQITISPLHAEKLPDACSPLLETLHDEAGHQLSVMLHDEQHMIITIPWSVEANTEAVQRAETRHREMAVDCLRELRDGELDNATDEGVCEARRDAEDCPEEDPRPTAFHSGRRKMKPDLRMWPVRLKPWWKRFALGEYAVLLGAWMLLVAIDCTLAVMSANWMILVYPLFGLAIFMFLAMIEHWTDHMNAVEVGLFVFLAAMSVHGLRVAEDQIRNTGWGPPVFLWHWIMLLAICWAEPRRRRKIWVEDEFPLTISVSATDGLFRLHGSTLCSGQPWQCAVPLRHIDKFHSLCHSPYWLNKTMGSYVVQVQRSDYMENSYVGFRSKDLTTLVVSLLNQALRQWRQLQASPNLYGTFSTPTSEVRKREKSSLSEPSCAANDRAMSETDSFKAGHSS